jgi:hypothetical protein
MRQCDDSISSMIAGAEYVQCCVPLHIPLIDWHAISQQ